MGVHVCCKEYDSSAVMYDRVTNTVGELSAIVSKWEQEIIN